MNLIYSTMIQLHYQILIFKNRNISTINNINKIINIIN
jgi:hypothetical protein